MAETEMSTDRLQHLIDRLAQGDDQARDEMLGHASTRLLMLTRRMFRGFGRLGRWEGSEDVCQNATLRLWKAMTAVVPRSAAEFYRLAAVQIRRELIDMARSTYGPEGIGANHASNIADEASGSTPPALYDPGDSTHEPDRVASWAEFHRQVEMLPAHSREVFDLIWYQGLSQAAAAALLGVSEPTIKRRWREARVLICDALDGDPPG